METIELHMSFKHANSIVSYPGSGVSTRRGSYPAVGTFSRRGGLASFPDGEAGASPPHPPAQIGPDNILTDPQQLDVPDWVIYGGVTDDGLTAEPGPDYSIPARKFHIPASSGSDSNVVTNLGNVNSTGDWVASVWLRGPIGGEKVYLHAFTVSGDGASLLCTLTTEWQQFYVVGQFVAFTDNVYVEIGYDGTFGALTPIAECDIEAAYAQLEPGDTPTT